MKAKLNNLSIEELSKLMRMLGCCIDNLIETKDASDRNIAWRFYEILDEVSETHKLKCELKRASKSQEYCDRADKLLEDLRK